jgi:Cathepsin propeptide inhibitor domain (I29)
MKINFFLVAFSIVTFVVAQKLSSENEEKIFVDFVTKFKIRLGRNSGSQRQNFLKNYYNVQEHNEGFRNGSKSFEMEINQFSHLSSEEFFATHTGYVPGTLDGLPSPFNVTRQSRMGSP